MRDYLNAHEGKAKEYSDLKEHLAEEYPKDRNAYTNGKSHSLAVFYEVQRNGEKVCREAEENKQLNCLPDSIFE